MEDMERYGDYNDTEEEGIPKQRNIFSTCVKLLLLLVIVAVIGLLGYRLFLFEYYPSDVKQFILTEQFTTLNEASNGGLRVKTQSLRFPYDDNDLDALNSNDLGTFFANYLYVCEDSGELQITVRVNTAGLTDIGAKYGVEDADPEEVAGALSFRLTDNYGREYSSLSLVKPVDYAMYRYYKLCFDGIDFTDPADGRGSPEWIRLEVLYAQEAEPYSYTLIYENNEDFSTFHEYSFTGKELSYRDF